MSKSKNQGATSAAGGVVNWNPPQSKDLVARAVADGMTDAAKIVAWAHNYQVTLTVEEVRRLMTELAK